MEKKRYGSQHAISKRAQLDPSPRTSKGILHKQKSQAFGGTQKRNAESDTIDSEPETKPSEIGRVHQLKATGRHSTGPYTGTRRPSSLCNHSARRLGSKIRGINGNTAPFPWLPFHGQANNSLQTILVIIRLVALSNNSLSDKSLEEA